MSAHLICPDLQQVWTNHVLPFLCATQTHWRKQMPIVLHQMMALSIRCRNPRVSCSSCRRHYSDCRSFWVTPNVQVSCLKVDYDVDIHTDCYVMYHVSDNGVRHCSMFVEYVNDVFNHRSFTSHVMHGMRLNLRLPVPMYYTNTWSAMVDHPPVLTDCVCLRRALVLHSIRNR
jgi:hypothetical protein